MRKLFLLLNLLLITGLCFAQAQVQVKLTQPPPNQLKATDLWRIVATNSNAVAYKAFLITVELREKTSGIQVESKLSSVTIAGSKSFSFKDFNTADLTYTNTKLQEAFGKNLNAPDGNYTICLYIKNEKGEEVTRNCIDQSVQNCDVNLALKLKSVECSRPTTGFNNYKICVSATYTSSNYNLTYSNTGSGFKAYSPSYTPAYTVSNITPALQVQNSGSATTVNYCIDVSVPVGQTALKVGLQGDDKDPGPIVCQPGAELDMRLPNCVAACDCGSWTPLVLRLATGPIKYDCGSKIPWKCSTPFNFTTSYQCSPANDKSCQAKTSWDIKKDGTSIKTGSGTNSITDSFTPTANGTYTITLNAECNGIKCPACIYTIVVEDCVAKCDCGTWGQLVIQTAGRVVKYDCNSRVQIPWNCNQPFNFTDTYQCSPANNESCLAKTSWEIKKDGTNIKTGSGTNSITDNFTPTSNGTYTITLNAECNGIKCPPCTYTVVVKDCKTCDCNKDMYVIVNPGNLKVRCKETQIFSYGATVNLIPQNICNPADCLTQWSMQVYDAQSGALVTSGNGTGSSSSFALTLNSTAGYRIELTGNCSGNKCSCEFWIRTKPSTGSICDTPLIFASANLNVGTMIESNAPGQQQTNNGIVEKYCYNNVAANCATYGGLYEWGEAMGYAPSNNNDQTGPRAQGICPTGYHIPSNLEWARYEYCVENNIAPTGTTTLVTFQTTTFSWMGTATGSKGPGAKMKAASPGWDGTNASGFKALPAGERVSGVGGFSDLGTWTAFWSATESSATRGWYQALNPIVEQIGRNNTQKDYGLSVRCVKD